MNTRIPEACLVVGLCAATAFAVPPTMHVTWSESPPPVQDVHYEIDNTDPDFPNVQLIEESLTWRIWSEDSDNPNNIGDIGVISSPHPKNFGVKIEDDLGNPGARTVKGIILDPTNAGNFSNITGGTITGNLDGDLSVKQSDTGTGGQADFRIDGHATGNIAIPTIASAGALSIGGNVETGAAIYIAQIGPGGAVSIAGDLAGKLELQNGLPDGTSASVYNLTADGLIDLTGQGVGSSAAFTLTVSRGSGTIVNGGAVRGRIC